MPCLHLALEDILFHALRLFSCDMHFPFMTLMPPEQRPGPSAQHQPRVPLSQPVKAAGKETSSPGSLGGLAFPYIGLLLFTQLSCSRGGLGELAAWAIHPHIYKATSLKSCLPFTREGPKQESFTSTATKTLTLVISYEQLCDCCFCNTSQQSSF